LIHPLFWTEAEMFEPANAGPGNVTATIKAIYHEKSFSTSTSELPENSSFGIILDRTGFYAESGGQEYDTGNITIDGVAEFAVENVQVFNGYVLHIGQLKYGTLQVGDEVFAAYDEVCSMSAGRFQTDIHWLR
jgi:alanyl-tRNA synthetase